MEEQPYVPSASDPSQADESVQKVAGEVSSILTREEQILYVCMQNFNAGPIKKAIVATTRRLIYFEPQIFGRFNFRDYLWQDVQDAKLDQGIISSELTVRMIDGPTEVLGNLEKDQARRMYSICQQFEEEWRERHRLRQLEEDRARSGGVFVQPSAPAQPAASGPAAPQAQDPVERLGKLKAMLDQGLISEEEYNTTKARILESM